MECGMEPPLGLRYHVNHVDSSVGLTDPDPGLMPNTTVAPLPTDHR
jgi:hypothetical protein